MSTGILLLYELYELIIYTEATEEPTISRVAVLRPVISHVLYMPTTDIILDTVQYTVDVIYHGYLA